MLCYIYIFISHVSSLLYAYDKSGHEFCADYENNLNKFLGIKSALIYLDEGCKTLVRH